MSTQKVATLMRTLPWDNEAALYQLSPAFRGVEFVITSTTLLGNGTTGTLVLAATDAGDVVSWVPLTAALAGHADAIAALGYEVRS
jgi:hypothetical protein